MYKFIYMIIVMYFTYCSSLGMQFFLYYLLEKKPPLYYLFTATHFVSLALTMCVLDRLGKCSKQLNDGIVITSMILAAVTLKYTFQPY